MIEEVMELHEQIHVLGELLVKSLIPVGWRTVHACEGFERIAIGVMGKCELGDTLIAESLWVSSSFSFIGV